MDTVARCLLEASTSILYRLRVFAARPPSSGASSLILCFSSDTSSSLLILTENISMSPEMVHVMVYSTIASGVGSKEFKFRVSPACRHHCVTTQAATNITWESTLTHVGHPRGTLRSSSQPRWALQANSTLVQELSAVCFLPFTCPPSWPSLFSETTQPVLYPIPHIA